jgi:hypothetical protein
MTAGSGRISVPRPAPGDVLLAVTDADGASCWTSCPKADLGELGPGLLSYLEEGQRLVHEQRQAQPG